jgi:hypothetical protein
VPVPLYERIVIGELDNSAACSMNTLVNVADLDADGRPDVFVAGRDGLMAWFRNPGQPGRAWTRHIVGEVSCFECGGTAFDLDGDGWPDIVTGGDSRSNEVAWWRNPGPDGGAWERRVLFRAPGKQFHDIAVGDVAGDGRVSVVFGNQGSASLFWAPVPEYPAVSPWPHVQRIADGLIEEGLPEEGLCIADIDGDGRNEVVAGTRWFRYVGAPNGWEAHKFASGYVTTVIAVGDVDGDGRPEIVLSEGDPCIYGHPEGGKVGWFKPGPDIGEPWTENRLDEGLLDAHSLQMGDLCGNGRSDILVGEIGVAQRLDEAPPRLLVYENLGDGRLKRHTVDVGIGTHHARLVDLFGRGVLDIVSRPLHGPDRWKVFAWIRQNVG